MELRPDDRLLVLKPAADLPLTTWAQQVEAGLLVVVAEGETVYELRRALREFPNVMVTPAGADGVIPWRDGFFTVLWAAEPGEAGAEMRRVLQPDGRTFTGSGGK
ncbi:MAG TPA: hypothetical protein VES20_14470 [Bryobacteraceae bacterium]|nr:hypothetical protein [Bryobacteraceae bacterium]